MAAIELTDIAVVRGERRILGPLSWNVDAGQRWAVLGPNGCGKSTLLGICGALWFPTTGTASLLNERLGRTYVPDLKRRIGHVQPRHELVSRLTLLQVVVTGSTGTTAYPMRWAPDRELLEAARNELDFVGLVDRADTYFDVASQGERGRSLIARALLAQPELLLLDEPAAGLDLGSRELLLTTLDRLAEQQPELATVHVSHHLEELPSSTTHAMLMRAGQVVSAGPIQTVLTSESLSETFGLNLTVDTHDGRWSVRTATRQ